MKRPLVMFGVDYLWNGWVKKGEVNVNLTYSSTIVLTLDTALILPVDLF